MKMRKILITIIAFGMAGASGYSQMTTKLNPVDTVATTDGLKRVILFSNGTWRYLGKDEPEAEPREKWIPVAPDKVFEDCWTENSISAYHTTLAELPDNVLLHLAGEDTVSFHCPYVGAPSSRYGYRHRRRHTGTDIAFAYGEPIRAAFDGKVRASIYHPRGYGNLVIIRHANGLETFYGHLAKRNVEAGEWVRSGDIIGLGGSTGHSTGPHLHFETRYQGFPFDPERIIDFSSGNLRSADFNLRKSYFGANSRFAASGNYNPIEEKADEQQSEQPVYHVVKGGETLSGIARKYGLTISALCKMNNRNIQKTLRTGEKLKVK